MKELFKSSKIYLHLVNLITTFPVMLHIIPIIILIILSSSCTPTVEVKPVGHTHFTLVDKKLKEHQYNKPIIIKHGRRKVMYCRTHHRWEVIRSYWNHKRMDYEYYVIKHPKN